MALAPGPFISKVNPLDARVGRIYGPRPFHSRPYPTLVHPHLFCFDPALVCPLQHCCRPSRIHISLTAFLQAFIRQLVVELSPVHLLLLAMPPKYAHVKKRPPKKKAARNSTGSAPNHSDHHTQVIHVDLGLCQALTAVAILQRTIAQIFIVRAEQDLVRLFSTHLFYVALIRIPNLVLRCTNAGGSSWLATNADCEEVKELLRSIVAMELRQNGERVSTKSILWTYTALRFFVSQHFPVLTASVSLLPAKRCADSPGHWWCFTALYSVNKGYNLYF